MGKASRDSTLGKGTGGQGMVTPTERPVPHKQSQTWRRRRNPAPPTPVAEQTSCREPAAQGGGSLGLQRESLGACSRHTKVKTLEGGQALTTAVSMLSRGSRRLELGPSSGNPSRNKHPNRTQSERNPPRGSGDKRPPDLAEGGQAWTEGAGKGGVGGPATSRPQRLLPNHLSITGDSQGRESCLKSPSSECPVALRTHPSYAVRTQGRNLNLRTGTCRGATSKRRPHICVQVDSEG